MRTTFLVEEEDGTYMIMDIHHDYLLYDNYFIDNNSINYLPFDSIYESHIENYNGYVVGYVNSELKVLFFHHDFMDRDLYLFILNIPIVPKFIRSDKYCLYLFTQEGLFCVDSGVLVKISKEVSSDKIVHHKKIIKLEDATQEMIDELFKYKRIGIMYETIYEIVEDIIEEIVDLQEITQFRELNLGNVPISKIKKAC